MYWKSAQGEAESPIGPLITYATAEGYGDKAQSFHGYFFRILKSQGPQSPGGAKDYVANGKMTAGFAFLEIEWLTAKEAAEYLKVRPRTLLLWARQGKVPGHRLSGIQRCIYRFLRHELDFMLGVSTAGPAEGGSK